MKKAINVLIFIVILLLVILYQNNITTFIMRTFIYPQTVNIPTSTAYHKENKSFFLSITNDFIIKKESQIPDVIYTVLDSGWNNFSFYCDYNYSSCIDDFKKYFDNSFLLSSINVSIHPYNTYRNIQLQISNYNKLTLNINRLYTPDEITYLDNKVDTIYNEVTNSSMSVREKILSIHDYIANHTYYDQNYTKVMGNSNNAYGALAEGKAICSGYADAMQLFLIKMNVPNYKLTSNDHIWNYVYLDNAWYHLDVSWDDPVTSSGKDKLIHSYFIIDDATLKSYHDGEHDYNNLFVIKNNI